MSWLGELRGYTKQLVKQNIFKWLRTTTRIKMPMNLHGMIKQPEFRLFWLKKLENLNILKEWKHFAITWWIISQKQGKDWYLFKNGDLSDMPLMWPLFAFKPH